MGPCCDCAIACSTRGGEAVRRTVVLVAAAVLAELQRAVESAVCEHVVESAGEEGRRGRT